MTLQPTISCLPAKVKPRRATQSLWIVCILALPVQAQPPDSALLEKARTWFKPLPDSMATADQPTPPDRVALGRRLFFDKRLSLDGAVSCETCHLPGLHGADGLSKSIGVQRRLNGRNAPTVLNAALQFKAHWDGGRESVEDQATRALIGHASFGNSDYPAVIRKLKALGYEPAFRAAFPGNPDPVRPENWGKAIGGYERTLVTPAPFDAFLRGETSALPEPAQRGLALFMEQGCVNCHQGVALGGTSFQKFGLFGEYWKATGNPDIDPGRFTLTQDPADRYVFKVPGLRNVAATPPYFHDGSVANLETAIRVMGGLQLGKTLTPTQTADIAAFLNSLTGAIPPQFTAPAALPE